MLVALVAAILGAATGWVSYRSHQARRYAVIAGELAAIADLKLATLEWWRYERLADARYLAVQAMLQPGVASLLTVPDSPAADPGAGAAGRAMEPEVEGWLASFLDGAEYSSVLLVDRSARVRVVLPATAGRLESVEQEWVAEVLQQGRPVLRDLPWSSASNAPPVDLVVPVGTEGGPVLGVLVLRTETRKFMDRLLSAWPLASVP
ncbi:MAG: hypothetical protein Q8M03_12550, partial [Legionella sp.]|nr:hypothetical protein [Legionella sp.]